MILCWCWCCELLITMRLYPVLFCATQQQLIKQYQAGVVCRTQLCPPLRYSMSQLGPTIADLFCINYVLHMIIIPTPRITLFKKWWISCSEYGKNYSSTNAITSNHFRYLTINVSSFASNCLNFNFITLAILVRKRTFLKCIFL